MHAFSLSLTYTSNFFTLLYKFDSAAEVLRKYDDSTLEFQNQNSILEAICILTCVKSLHYLRLILKAELEVDGQMLPSFPHSIVQKLYLF